MDLLAIVNGLCGFQGRSAGTDAERRAAGWLRERLAAGKRDAALELAWVRPHWSTSQLFHALAGAIGGLVATAAAIPGLVIVGLALLSTLSDMMGRPSLGRMLTFRRATQNVVAPPPRARSNRVRLVIVANYDAARRGLVFRPSFRRFDAVLRRATRGLWPNPLLWMALALAVVTATAASRVAGYDPEWLSIVQLVPTVVLLVAVALLADISLSEASPDASGASAVAVAMGLVAALDAQPLARLDVELVLAGAGDGPTLGAGTYVDKRRGRWDPARVAFLEIRPCGAGKPAYWVKDGPLVALKLHPGLIEQAGRVARGEEHLEATEERGRTCSAAYRARRARWPALALGALAEDGTVPHRRGPEDVPDTLDAKAMDATLELCLGLVVALDEDLAKRGDESQAKEAAKP